jgi:excisionase family DNA binding protein
MLSLAGWGLFIPSTWSHEVPKITTVTSYNLTEAAARLGVSRVTVWRAIRDGKLVGTRSGREQTITADDLLDYVLRERGGRGIPAA